MKRWAETLPHVHRSETHVHRSETPVHKSETPVHESYLLEQRIRCALWNMRDQVLLHGGTMDDALFKLSLCELRLLALDVEDICRTLGVKI